MGGDGLGVTDVVFPWAFAREGEAFLVHPGPEVSGMDLVALLLEQQGGHGAVDAAGKGYEDFGHPSLG